MTEGFDIGLEMSGNGSGITRHDRQHEPRVENRDAGDSDKEMSIDWRTVVFNMLTIKGIYGREMYETWYKMTVMLHPASTFIP